MGFTRAKHSRIYIPTRWDCVVGALWVVCTSMVGSGLLRSHASGIRLHRDATIGTIKGCNSALAHAKFGFAPTRYHSATRTPAIPGAGIRYLGLFLSWTLCGTTCRGVYPRSPLQYGPSSHSGDISVLLLDEN